MNKVFLKLGTELEPKAIFKRIYRIPANHKQSSPFLVLSEGKVEICWQVSDLLKNFDNERVVQCWPAGQEGVEICLFRLEELRRFIPRHQKVGAVERRRARSSVKGSEKSGR